MIRYVTWAAVALLLAAAISFVVLKDTGQRTGQADPDVTSELIRRGAIIREPATTTTTSTTVGVLR